MERFKQLTDEEAIAAARRRFSRDDEIEIDDTPTVSRPEGGGDDVSGVFVAAWVWVEFDYLGDDDEENV